MKILSRGLCSIILFSRMIFTFVEVPFGISFLKKGFKNQVLYGAAHPNYSLQGKIKDSAVFIFNGITIQPLTPENVTINVINASQPNPLYDQGIRAFACITPEQRDLPVLLSTADQKRVYLFENVETGSLLVSEPLKDSQGNDVASLEGLAASIDGLIFTITLPTQGLLGSDGTGIGAVKRGYSQMNNQVQRIFTQVALNNFVDSSASSYPFNLSSPIFTFNNHAAQSFESPVLCWDDSLQCLYVGLTAIGAQDSDGGVKSMAVFSIRGNTPSLIQLIDDQALVGNDDLLLSARGLFSFVTVNSINVMNTSTGLSYLVVGVGFGEQQEIRVLPLVNDHGPYQGTVASKTSAVSNLYFQSSRYAFFQKRVFDQPALVPTDLFEKTELPVRIGFDQAFSTFLYANMSSCTVQGDTIFITVNIPNSPEQSGIFSSRALFGPDGRIVSWTRWERAQQTAELFFQIPDLKQGGFYTATGSDGFHVSILSKSDWRFGQQSSLSFLGDLFKKYLLTDGLDLSCSKTLFEANRVNNSVLFVAGSQGKLLVNALGIVSEQGIIIRQSISNGQETIVTNQTTELAPNTTTLVFSDPILESVGFISDCSYAYHQDSSQYPNQEFLAVSGTNGVVLLSQFDYSGWPLDVGIGNNFSNLLFPVRWTSLESQRYVKKIIADKQYLYLVTDTQIIRINMNESNLATQVIDKVVIANIEDFENTQSFVDFIPSQSHGIVATTNGLYYADITNSVQTDSSQNILWQKVTMPESVSSIEHIQVVTQSGNPVDMAKTSGSQIIISATSQSSKRGAIVRAVFNQDGTVICFNDHRIKGVLSHCIDYGAFIKNSYSDGAFWYALIKSQRSTPRPSLIGSVTVEPATPFLGLMPSYISLFDGVDKIFPRAFVHLPMGGMMITTNKEFAITE